MTADEALTLRAFSDDDNNERWDLKTDFATQTREFMFFS